MMIGIGIPSSQSKMPLPIFLSPYGAQSRAIVSGRYPESLLLVDDFASRVFGMTDCVLQPPFSLFLFPLGFGGAVAGCPSNAFLYRARGFLDAAANAIFVHFLFPM